jgi:hypothetical protein
MTSIGASSSASSYSSAYATILANAQKQAASAASAASAYSSGSSSATMVTLSEEAKAAMTLKDFATVIADARATMDKLLTEAKLTSPLKDGKLALDLSKVDRRELYAMSINGEQKFSVDEQKAAQIELQNRFDQALAGPTAVGRVTGKIDGLYTAALAYFDAMGPEEKATAEYADARKAIEAMIAKLKTDPGTLPGAFPNDPVNDYMQRLAEGETGELRDIADVGSDARATLDAQYETGATLPSYTDFDSRSLAAVAINTGGEFTEAEVRAAKSEMRSRTGAAVLAALKNSDAAANPAGFSENIISLYGAMSAEERAAAGWSDNLYAAAVSSYQTASKLASMLGSATGNAMWGGGSGEQGSSSNSTSLLSYL